MSKFIKISIGIGISAFFLWLVVRDIHLDAFLEAIQNANLWILFGGLFVWMIGYGIRGVRARVLLLPVKDIPWRRSMAYVLVGFTANNTLPLRAGEIVRPYVVGTKEHISKTTVFATIAAERLFDGLVIVLLTIVGASVMPIESWMKNVIWLSAMLFIFVLISFIFLLFYNRQSMAIIGFFLKYLPDVARKKIESLLNVFTTGLEFLRNPAQLISVSTTTVLIWLCEGAFYLIAGVAFGFDMSFLQALFVMGMLNLAILIPSSPGYVGTFEYVTVATLGLIGISHSQAAGYALVCHIIQFLAICIPGGILWLKMGLSMGDVREPAEESMVAQR